MSVAVASAEPASEAGSGARELWTAHLGRVPYREGVALQEELRERRQRDALADSLLLLEHPPVYTHGRRTGPGRPARWASSGTPTAGSRWSTPTAAGA